MLCIHCQLKEVIRRSLLNKRRIHTAISSRSPNASQNKENKLSDAEKAKQIILSQLENKIDIPLQKSWSSTAMLETLNKSTQYATVRESDGLYTPMFWGVTHKNINGNQNAIITGEQIAEHIIRENSELFSFDWDADNPDIWLKPNQPEIEILKPIEQTAEMQENGAFESFFETSVESLEKLIQDRKVPESINMYHRLVKQKIVIPDSVFNHFFGFIAFYRGNSEDVERLQNSPEAVIYRLPDQVDMSELEKVFNSIKNPTPEQISVMILAYRTNKESVKVIQLYKKHFYMKKITISVETINNLIFASRFVPERLGKLNLIKESLQLMKSLKLSPDYETYHCLIQNYLSFNLGVGFFDTILDHMRKMDLKPCLYTYANIFMFLSSPILSRKIYSTTLHNYMDRIANTEFTYRYYKDVVAFSQIMRSAKSDPSLAHKVYNLYVYKQNRKLTKNVERMHFHNHYLDCILVHGPTMDDVYKLVCKLIPMKSVMTWHRKNMLLGCIKRYKAPEYLPILLTEVLQPKIWMKAVNAYMTAAVNLYQYADENTVTQLKNVSLLVLNLAKKESPENILNYSQLVSVCIVLLAREPTDAALLQKGMLLLPELKPSYLTKEAKEYCDAYVKENDFVLIKNLLQNIEVKDPDTDNNKSSKSEGEEVLTEPMYPHNYVQMNFKKKSSNGRSTSR